MMVILVGIFPLSALKKIAPYIGQLLTTIKPARHTCRNNPSLSPSLIRCLIPTKNDTKLISAAIVIGTNMGDLTPNSYIPWSYLLRCWWSITLGVKLNPSLEIPRCFAKYSKDPNRKHDIPLIIHILWSFHHLWVVPLPSMKPTKLCPYPPKKRNTYNKKMGSDTCKTNNRFVNIFVIINCHVSHFESEKKRW